MPGIYDGWPAPCADVIRPGCPGQAVLTCCGLPMTWREVFGIRVYDCQLRNHPRVYVRGDQAVSKNDLDVHHQGWA